ncbi:MAG: hypothetical protein Aurels2KO_33530 [Aureliella sp.]
MQGDMVMKDKRRRRLQFSLKTFLTACTTIALAIAVVLKLISATPLAIAIVCVILLLASPFMLLPSFIDWLLKVDQSKE